MAWLPCKTAAQLGGAFVALVKEKRLLPAPAVDAPSPSHALRALVSDYSCDLFVGHAGCCVRKAATGRARAPDLVARRLARARLCASSWAVLCASRLFSLSVRCAGSERGD